MNHLSYLIFELGQSRYGVATSDVQELFFLPDVTPIPEAPVCVSGVINLRGDILPIIDLPQCLGLQSSPYQITHSVIVLQWQNQRVGIVVDQVYDVQAIAPEQLQPVFYEPLETGTHRLITGIAFIDTTLVTLLNSEGLVQLNTLLPQPNWNTSSNGIHNAHANGNGNGLGRMAIGNLPKNPPKMDMFAHLSPEERQILCERSSNLRQVSETHDSAGIPLVVMGLRGEYFGLGLDIVHEFTDIRKLTPVPCCPSHILGNMNLRGEIVTVIDISQSINLTGDTANSTQKAIVVRLDELTAGIAVDEIFDVIQLNPTQISTAPVATRSAGDDYLQGVAAYRDRLMSIINLPKLLASDALVVNEEI
ncbi:MAG TPA: chemotaxis protein CheW [Crinalium sp.]|jgi:purine-binding chemotaxis protein CheW